MAALVILNGLKIAIRYLIVITTSQALLTLFAVFDSIALLLLAPWAAIAPPLPRTNRDCLMRALRVSLVLEVGLALVNVLLQVGPIWARRSDNLAFAIEMLLGPIPNAVLGGPLGGVAKLILATTIAYVAARLFMPAQPRAAPPRPVAPQPAARRSRQ